MSAPNVGEVLEARFFSRISPEPFSGCWLWSGAFMKDGYGSIRFDGQTKPAHRVSWFIEHGNFPLSELDHKCRVHSCVNPQHLEPVSHKENCNRGIAAQVNSIRGRTRTGCKNGHEYVNGSFINVRGYRECIICHRHNARKR